MAFAAFLDFLRRNLNGQTTVPTHPVWASQSEVVSGFARFAPPDMLLREADLDRLTPVAALGLLAALQDRLKG